MIRLEYDPPTAGVRVSFVIRDGSASCAAAVPALLLQGTNGGDGTWTVPQNAETLDVVQSLLEHARAGDNE